ncbi:MAG: hypothetical protein J6V72_10510 [Kiritimatiellae bacterium]|nr:hypothetical protein [Kiritimatiellia bacterium]
MNINRNSIVRGIAATLLFSAVSCPLVVSAAWSENVITQTLDGVKWRFKIDESNKTALLGTSDSTTGSDAAQYWATDTTTQKENNINVKKGLRGVVESPSSFTVDGVAYDLIAIGNRALIRYGMSTLILPENIGRLRNCALYQMPYMTNLWFKGHSTPSSEFGRNYVDLNFTATSVLDATTSIKNVLVGPNLKRYGSSFTIPNGTNTLVLFPYRKDNTTWAGVNVGGTTPNVVYYNDIDDTAGTITFSPTNATQLAEAFATLPTIAPQIKTAFGFDAKVVVNTPIDEATAIPAAFLDSGIPLETTEWVAFTATTQTQLGDVLDACSASSKVLIDPTGATERLVVPAGRNVAMLMSPGGEVKPEMRGFMMIVR